MLKALGKLIAAPVPHFMAFAPLDAWARLLAEGAGVPAPRYWPRLAFALFTSCIGTALTLPERVALAPLLAARRRRSGATIDHKPGAVVILGYARSGTTHLHYLLSCDRRFRTPRWHQCLAPQGFALSWTFLRLFLVPFMSNKRLMDDMAFGPEWPAEDEFAVNNWSAASGIPGRLILPRRYEHYRRYHFLRGLSHAEHARWRNAQWAFVTKLSWLAGRRALLLKSPSHTARVRELFELFSPPSGPPRVKFIHITRPPDAVVRSNVAMLTRASIYHLQDAAPEAQIERTIVEELAETSRVYTEQAGRLPPGTLAQMRYQDLLADPIAELQRVYAELDIPWTPDFEARLVRYLHSVKNYRAAHGGEKKVESAGQLDPKLAPLIPAFGHDKPVRPKAALPPVRSPRPPRIALAAALVTLLALALGAAWVAVGHATGDRLDTLAWPLGVTLGLTAMVVSRLGSLRLGVYAAALTLLTTLAVAMPLTRWVNYAHKPWDLIHVRDELVPTTISQLTAGMTIFWTLMGILSAYRFASRRQLHPDNS
jgi:hypothetical protein